MARTWICGWEGGLAPGTASRNIDSFSISGTGMTFDTGVSRSGAYSLKLDAVSGNSTEGSFNNIASYTGYIRFYLRAAVKPTSTRGIAGSVTGSINLRMNPTGNILYYYQSTLIGTSTTALSDTTRWYCIEVRQADGTNVVVLRIDGNNEVTGSPSTWTGVLNLGTTDTVTSTMTMYYDDYVCDNAAFPGPGNVVLLKPTADNTVTNWRLGGGSTTTNLFAAVNVIPPGGVASANETDSTNIECASNTGTATYIATMETYASAGITASATVNSICTVVVHGEDINTGTKTGTVELTQNPVVSANNFGSFGVGFGSDGGAHGVYSDAVHQWSVLAGNSRYTNAPSVAVGTAPLMKLVKTDTTTRIGCVCFMGIYVDYTPAASFIAAAPKLVRQAVNRASSF